MGMGMGYVSWILKRRRSSSRSDARVVDLEGNILRLLKIPTTVAELMLEIPGHMVSSAEEVRRTRRLLAMKADEELLPGGVYLLFPVNKMGCRVPDLQIPVVLDDVIVKKREGRQRKNAGEDRGPTNGRVFPVVACEEEEEVEEEKEMGTGFPGHRRVSVNRHWKPVLDTIHESK